MWLRAPIYNIWAPSDELQNEHEMRQSIMSGKICSHHAELFMKHA